MRSYVMEYRVPLYVTVRDGHIVRVRVDDEARLTDGMLWTGDTYRRVTDERIVAAIKTVVEDADADWPAWEFGP